MTDLLSNRLARLHDSPDILRGSLRGIEKEGLRVDSAGRLSRLPHPLALGSALTHPSITTDYSEALLELITSPHTRVDDLIAEIGEIHRVVAANLGDELMWNHSMPAALPSEAEIPIAWYGTSNTGMLKHVYRRGLAVRYGKTMQCIAGLHYNFSFDEAIWNLPGFDGDDPITRRSAGYIALIRNFMRYSWLLMYLFGSTPALSRDFLRDGEPHGLLALDDRTLYLPHATSLRMSDLGYQNKAQSGLKLCYNDLGTFLSRLYNAVTTPWPAYEKIGTHRDGEWIQLNTNILQIENEFYSSIRPKRTTGRCERPITALSERGVQYIEVRCMDIDPTQPVGISPLSARFLDAFLLFCTLKESPMFSDSGYCPESAANFSQVVKVGRRPGLALHQEGVPIPLADWAGQLLDEISRCAGLLDFALAERGYAEAVEAQRGKVRDPETTPSAMLLNTLRNEGISFHDFALRQSAEHARALRNAGLSLEQAQKAKEVATRSLQEQAALEASDTEPFEAYVARFHAALKAPTGE